MLAAFTFTDRARPLIEIGLGDSRTLVGAAWDVGLWDDVAARWSGLEPSWFDISCDTRSANLEYGRARVIDRFVAGTATVVVDNSTGWADPDVADAVDVLNVRPGRQIRISIVHAIYGRRVLFRGYIDSVTPVYSPTDTDTVELSCIDALGEVNRTKMKPQPVPVGAGEWASARISRILDAAGWLPRDIQPSAEQLIATDLGGQVADMLGQTADSCGGSVFGDLEGRVAFRPRDWQSYLPDTPPDGTIGNVEPGHTIPGTPAVPAHLDPSVGTVTVPYTAGTGVVVTADPPAAATYWRTVGGNAEIGRDPAGTVYPGTIQSFTVTQTPPPAATLLEPFNNYTDAPWTTTGSCSIVTGRTSTGAQIGGTPGTNFARYTIPSGNRSATATIGFAFRISNATGNRSIFRLESDSGATPAIFVNVQTTGSVEVRLGTISGNLLAASATSVLPINTYKYVELQAFIHDTTGFVTLHVDGTQVAAATNVDTKVGLSGAVFDAVCMLAPNSGINNIFDDLYIDVGPTSTFRGDRGDITVPAVSDPGFTFDADDYPGTGLSYVDPRGETWTLTAPGAIVPTVPATPDVVTEGDVCPVQWERPFARADITTRAIIGRDPETAVVVDDPAGISRYGIEPFERTDLLTQSDPSLTMLAERVIRTRGETTAPRVRSVALDANTTTEALDLMATVDVHKPSRYRCRLEYPPPRGMVFDDQYFATGVNHELTPSSWTLNINLDLAAPFAVAGGRWDSAYWDLASWTTAARALLAALRADLTGVS